MKDILTYFAVTLLAALLFVLGIYMANAWAAPAFRGGGFSAARPISRPITIRPSSGFPRAPRAYQAPNFRPYYTPAAPGSPLKPQRFPWPAGAARFQWTGAMPALGPRSSSSALQGPYPPMTYAQPQNSFNPWFWMFLMHPVGTSLVGPSPSPSPKGVK